MTCPHFWRIALPALDFCKCVMLALRIDNTPSVAGDGNHFPAYAMQGCQVSVGRLATRHAGGVITFSALVF